MKLISQVKKHGKAVTLHLKRYHRKYIFGIVSISLLVKGISLIAAHVLVHNLSFANTVAGDNNDSTMSTGFDNNALSENLDESMGGGDNENNTENSEDPEESEESAELEEPIIFENLDELKEPIKSEESTVDENPDELEEPIKSEESTVDENPDELEEPIKSEESTDDENPDESEEPIKSEESTDDENPDESEEPIKSEESTVDENLDELKEPIKSEESTDDVNSFELEEPIKSEESTDDVNSFELEEPIKSEEPTVAENPEELEEPTKSEETDIIDENLDGENEEIMTRGIDDAINNSHELTTFEKAFQEVAYAYYMRGPYMHYNAAKSMSDILSPEESTSQDYHYMTCTPYVMNVFKELLGIVLTSADEQYGTYARDYVGIRPEVIGYGEKSGSNLLWTYGTGVTIPEECKDEDQNPISINPTQSCIIKQLKIGDILYYAGHTMLVYDYVYSGNDIVDVYLLHSRQANYITRTKADHSNKEKYYNKSGQEIGLKLGNSQRSRLGYNYRDRVGVYPGLSRVEGTVILERLREHKYLTFTQPYESKYSILRLVTTNSSGEDLLNFNGQWTGGDQYNTKKFLYYGFLALGTGPDTLYEPDNSLKTFDNQKINNYSDSVKSRLKYSKLYIEKTVDKKDNNIVEPDDELTYKIMIKNESKENYENDLIVTEYIDIKLVENLHKYVYSGASSGQVQIETENENQLQWNIGKLNSGDVVVIEYKVKVKTGHIGETIESTGLVDNIPSGTIKNKIGKNLKEEYYSGIANEYEQLKVQGYTGRTLINKIYENVYSVDLGLDSFVMTGYISRNGTIIEGQSGLIFYTKTGNAGWNPKIHNYMYINQEHLFSGMVLNSYFNVLGQSGFEAIDRNITLYEVPTLLPYKNPDNRANTIYPTDFKTGDILIYINENDVKYTTGLNSNGDKITKEIPISYEDGEYVYIYIDGKFMGVNLGKDGVKDNRDDRNEFGTIEYHVVNKVDSYNRVPVLSGEYLESGAVGVGCRKTTPGSYCIKIPNDELKEFLRYQTLFGKDAYVVLRPSLVLRNITYELNGGANNEENPNGFIPGNDVVLKDPTKTGFTFYGWYTDSGYTNRVYNTSEFTDDVTLYAKWDLTTFQKAFQEVAYAYYMRGPYIHYNSAKGRGHDFSPEEATSQDYNYLACGLYVLNVYRELLGNIITFPPHGAQDAYARNYVGKSQEVIGYGEKSGLNLLWWDSTTPYSGESKMINPTKNDIIKQLQIGDIFGYEGHVTMVYDYKYNESGDIEDVYLIHATDSPQYRVYSKMNLGVTVYDKSGTGYELSIGHNKWSAIRYNNFNRTAQSEHHPDARIEGTVQLNTMSKINQKLEFNTGNYLSHYYILRFVTDDGSGNSILSIDGRNLAGYRKCSTCSYTYYSGQVNYSDSIQSRLKYNKLYIEKTVNKRDNTIVGVGDELTYTIRIQNNSDQAYDDDLIIKENINTDLVENLSLYSYEKNGTQIQEIQLLNDGNQLQWNIGKLNSGDEVIIQYTVKVRPGNIGETIESTGMAGGIPSGIVTNTIGRNTDKGENLKIAYNDLRNSFTGKFLINEIYREVYGIDLGIDKIAEINTEDELDTGALIYYNNKWGNRGTSYDDVEMKINRKSPYSGMILNSYFNVLYKNINDAHAVNKSGDEIIITRYGFPAIASNDVDKRADTIFPGNFQTGDILIYKNSNDLYYIWETSSGYAKVSHTNTYENGEYVYIYMDGKFVGMNLGNDLTGARDDRNEFTTDYFSNVGIRSRYYTDSGVGVPQNIPGGFNNWLHYQSLFGKEAYVILRPSLMIRDITYELDGGTNDNENPNAFILGRDIELKGPIRTGYVFGGWYTDPGYISSVDNTNELTDDVVLYAKWSMDEYSITYVLNNGTVSTANPESYTIESADITLNNPTRTGYDFKGWTGTDLGGLTMSITIPNGSTGDRTYVANWEAKDVGITINHYLQNLDADTNTLLDTYSNYKTSTGVEKADSTITLANYKLTNITGYVYDYGKANGTITTTTTVLPDGSSVFDLYYTRNTYSLAVNGIIGATIAGTSPMGRYYYGSNITLSGDVTNDCYMWSGWNIIGVPSTANKKITFSMPANAVTATQAITEKVYNIVFDGISNTSGSTNPMNNVKCTASVTLNPNGFNKIGYAFSGWATTSGGAKVYEDEQNVQTLSTGNNASVTLYAVWLPNVDTEYKVIHVYEGIGSTPEETVSKMHTGTSDITVTGQLLPRVGFNNPDKQLVYIKADGTAEITYYYDRTKYTITYNSNSGAAVDLWTGKYGAEIPRPDLSGSRGGYRFDGWSGVTTVPAENTGLVAQWTAIAVNYTVKHMQESANDTNYFEVESDRQILTGITDTNTNATAKVYSGFKPGVLTNVSINGDESTVVEVKYDREVYTVSFDSSSGTVVDPITGKYEQNLTAPANPKLSGYTFIGWEPEFPTKMPLDGTGLIAIWEANTGTAYTVEHYLQELDESYPETPNYTDNLSGTTDTQTNAVVKTYEGFTLSGNIEDYQENIDGDELTEVKLYYTRDLHTITFIDSNGNETDSVRTGAFGAETSGNVDFPVWNRVGFTLSWSGEIPAIVPAEDIIITAIWTENPKVGGKLKKDKCPGGDFSDSYYDGECGKSTNNTHGSAAEDSYNRGEELKFDTLKYNPKYSNEMNQAYQYAYYYGITTKGSIKDADMNGKLTRIAMAKMLTQYAINVLGMKPDSTITKKFSDVSNKLDKDYDNGVTLAYQLGIMGINMPDNKFRPNDSVTRAEFVTALSRMKYGTKDGKDVYYSTHMNLLKDLGIITVTDPTMKELRGYVMIMLMRSAK